MKNRLLLSLGLCIASAHIAPTDTTSAVTTQEEKKDVKQSKFFSEIRYFVIAALTLQTMRTIADCYEKANPIKTSDIFSMMHEGLTSAFYIWLVDKIKHLDRLADYYAKNVDEKLENLQTN